MFSKPIMDLMVREQHLPKKNKKIIKKLIVKLENVLDDFFVSFLAKSILKMSFNRSRYEYFFPSIVFCCVCLAQNKTL